MPLTQVNGVAITADEVERALGAPLRKLEEQIYQLKRQKLEAPIAERLLAAEAPTRGISVQALLDAEVTAKVGLVTEAEIETVYQAKKAQVRGEESAVREELRAQLQKQKLAAQRATFIDSLRSQARVAIHLQAPVFRVEVATAAAEAARCARDQGKFWEYHDSLFAAAPRASSEELKRYAEEVGLNLARFESCLSEGTYQAAVQADIEDGIRLGVTGTPAFFINGRLIAGAQPLESFAQTIDAELARARVGQAAGAGGPR